MTTSTEWFKWLFGPSPTTYVELPANPPDDEQLLPGAENLDDSLASQLYSAQSHSLSEVQEDREYSRADHLTFVILGMAMLWSWNMFIAAGTYFQYRFKSNEWIYGMFQTSELVVATVVNLGAMVYLSKRQRDAEYSFRVFFGLELSSIAFLMLLVSAMPSMAVSAELYYVFLLVMIVLAMVSASLCQNGAFSYAANFNRPEYLTGLVIGQGIAGVLPSFAQWALTLWYGADAEDDGKQGDPSTSAQIFFLTAVLVSLLSLVAFVKIERREQALKSQPLLVPTYNEDELSPLEGEDEMIEARHLAVPAEQPDISLSKMVSWTLPYSASVACVFAVTMFFPFVSQRILWYDPAAERGPTIKLPDSPLLISGAILVWNLGDTAGRVLASYGVVDYFQTRPWTLFTCSLLRLLFLPVYFFLCNMSSARQEPYFPDAVLVLPNWAYLGLVHFPFGFTNGILSMAGIVCGPQVRASKRERVVLQSFMVTVLVVGLAVGSVLSFVASTVLP